MLDTFLSCIIYFWNVLSDHSKIDKTKILLTNGRLMKVESIAECSPCSILQYFWSALSDNWSWIESEYDQEISNSAAESHFGGKGFGQLKQELIIAGRVISSWLKPVGVKLTRLCVETCVWFVRASVSVCMNFWCRINLFVDKVFDSQLRGYVYN